MGNTKRTGRQIHKSPTNRSTGKTCPTCQQRNCTPRHLEHHQKLRAHIKTLRLIGLGYVERVAEKRLKVLGRRGHQHGVRTVL